MAPSWPLVCAGFTGYMLGWALPQAGLYDFPLKSSLDTKLIPVGAVTKAIPVLMLALDAWTAAIRAQAHKQANTYARYMAFGLFLGAMGDFFLDMSIAQEDYFKIGLVAFLMGHVWYIGAFAAETLAHSLVVGAACAAFVAGILYVILPHVAGDLALPVVVYATVIASMGYVAVTRKTPHTLSFRLGVLGALAFLVSDTVLAINKFVMNGEMPYAKIWVMVTYYGAQLLIAWSATSFTDAVASAANAKKASAPAPVAQPAAVADAPAPTSSKKSASKRDKSASARKRK